MAKLDSSCLVPSFLFVRITFNSGVRLTVPICIEETKMKACSKCGDYLLRLPKKIGRKIYCEPCFHLTEISAGLAAKQEAFREYNKTKGKRDAD